MSQNTEAKEESKPKFFIIDENLLQEIGSYLLQKPYGEVEKLIGGLKALQSVTISEQEEAPEEK